MRTKALIRSAAVATVAALVVVTAVKSAAASASAARTAHTSVSGGFRDVRIMITPNVAHNDIKLAQKNKAVDVAIIAETSWEFSDIEPQSVEFAGSIPAKSATGSKDVDADGVSDRIYYFTTSQLKLTEADTIACFKAVTIQKVPLIGCDKVKVIKASPN
jgi:hypothetical protein